MLRKFNILLNIPAAIFLFCGNISSLKAQSISNEKSQGNLVIGSAINYSFIYAHTDNVKHVSGTKPLRFELSLAKQTLGNKAWERAYNCPRYGLGISYINLQNQEYLGEILSVLAYMETINRRSGKFSFSFRVATGLAYSNKPFDFETNRKNQFISTTFCPAMQGILNFNFTLSPHLEWHNGLALTHFSNGAIKLPNKGINMIGIETGINYIPRNNKTADYVRYKQAFAAGWSYHLRFSGAIKQVTVQGDKYFLQILGFNSVYRIGYKSGLTIGLEFQNNPALMEEKLNEQPYYDISGKDIYRLTVPLGHELYINRVVMVNQIGLYLYSASKAPLPVYFSNGLRVHLTDRFWLSTLLRTHGGVAEFIEFGLGFKLK